MGKKYLRALGVSFLFNEVLWMFVFLVCDSDENNRSHGNAKNYTPWF